MIIRFLLIFSLSVLTIYLFINFTRRNFFLNSLVFIFSIASATIILIPDLSTEIAHSFGVGRGADLLLYFLFILTLFLIVMAHSKMKKLENQLTKLARKIAINEIKRK